ncbi:MAG: phosphoadenylyl-sulfate reductase [Methylococcales bacterium]|nr:phosphoadenylyl-sulfate reductase [Methylococcales bacterium]
MTTLTLDDRQQQLKGKNPRAILKVALQAFDQIALSFSGAEDVVLIDLAVKLKPDIAVFCLDTGRLPPETYRFLDKVREHYRIDLDILSPDPEQLEPMVREKGLFSFYRDGHQECCGIRKVQPLKRKLATLDAWITGQRRDQSLDTRQQLAEVEADTAFAAPGRELYKFNPLANWTSAQVWDHILSNNVPYNALHEQGFISIGCEPCTRPVRPNEHERAGRWWWEEATKKECGLHSGNLNAE